MHLKYIYIYIIKHRESLYIVSLLLLRSATTIICVPGAQKQS